MLAQKTASSKNPGHDAERRGGLGENWQRSVLRRAWLVRRLGKLGDSAAVEALVAILETDPDDDVRGLAAIALGRIGDPTVAPALRKGLDEPTAEGQISALLSLWLLRDRGSVPRLSERLRHSTSTDVRQHAAHALGDIGDQDTMQALIEALGDPEACVRSVAAVSLGKLGDVRALEPLRLARQSARGLSRRRMGQALKKLEGRLRPRRWSRVTARYPLDTDRLIAIQMALMAFTQFASSISKTMKVRGRKRRELAATIDRSRRLLSSERHQENFELLEESVQRFPEDPEIRLLYATILLEFCPDRVAAEAARAVELGSDDPRILVRAAQLLFDRGEIEFAKSCVTRANELAPPDFVLAPGLANLNGLIAAFDGEHELAEKKLRSALEREPDSGPFAIDLARYLVSRERREEALEIIDQTLTRTDRRENLERVQSEISRSD